MDLSLTQTHFLCALISGGFVLSLYLLPARVRTLPRNDPVHISYRLKVTVLATTFFYAGMYFSSIRVGDSTFLETVGLGMHRLLWSVLLTVVLMSLFYAGPIMTSLALAATKTQYSILPTGELGPEHEKPVPLFTVLIDSMQSYYDENGLMIFVRNLVAAPITEELVFRGLLVPLLTVGYSSVRSDTGAHVYSPFCVMLRCPLWFAMAHVHHLIERLRSGDKISFVLIGTALQITYTSIFGCIAAGFLMRTGNIYAPIASHMFCNYWGLPDLSFLSPPSRQRHSDLAFLYPYRYLLLVMHGVGLVAFSAVFLASTEHLTRESVFYRAF